MFSHEPYYHKRSGDFYFKDLQMDQSLCNEPVFHQYFDTDWYKHFSEIQKRTRGDIPLPTIYKDNELGLQGDLNPIEYLDRQLPSEDYKWVYLKNQGYIIAHRDELRPPSDTEYVKYFKELYENKTPRLKHRKLRLKVYTNIKFK